MQRWVPFDEERLYQLLGLDVDQTKREITDADLSHSQLGAQRDVEAA